MIEKLKKIDLTYVQRINALLNGAELYLDTEETEDCSYELLEIALEHTNKMRDHIVSLMQMIYPERPIDEKLGLFIEDKREEK